MPGHRTELADKADQVGGLRGPEKHLPGEGGERIEAVTFKALSKELQVLSEYEDVAQQVVTGEVVELLNECWKSVHIIYVSDVEKDPAW